MRMIELNKDNFDQLVTNSTGRVLVDFWSPGCGPCQMMEFILNGLADQRRDARFVKMNATEFPDVAWAFEVVAAPTLVLFENGRPIDRIEGAVPASRVEEMLSR